MNDTRTVVVVVHPETSPGRSSEILRWLRWLLPTALLVIAPTSATFSELEQVITIDVDAVGSGPLSVAAAVDRAAGAGAKR